MSSGARFFNSPLVGVPEIVKISVVGLVWCQMAHTLKIDAHLRSTILLDRMPPARATRGRNPRLRPGRAHVRVDRVLGLGHT